MSGLRLDLNTLRWAIVLCLLVSFLSQAKDIDERDWIFAESQNFSIYSAQGERRTRELLEHLEALRNVFEIIAGRKMSASSKPTRILAAASMRDYLSIGAPEGSAGIFSDTLRENFIAIGKSLHMSESQIILHEYVHYILRSNSEISLPPWLEEGFAEYVSASELKKKHFAIGLPLEGRFDYLRDSGWLPWESVVRASSSFGYSEAGRAAFYAQSWLLVHYLHNRGGDSPNVWDSLQRYSALLAESTEPVAAFEIAFELPMDKIGNRLKRYANQFRLNTFKFDRAVMTPAVVENIRPVSKTEIRVLLGEYALLLDDKDKAEQWFEAILVDEPDNPAAIAGSAAVLALEQEFDAASARYDDALKGASDDPRILMNAALLDLQRASQSDAWFTGGDLLDRAETRILKARDLTGGSTEIDTYLAYIWLSRDDASDSAIRLLSLVTDRAPAELWPKLLLAESLLSAGHPEPARTLAQTVLGFDHGSSPYSMRARRLLERIEDNDSAPDRALPTIPTPAMPRRD